MRSSFKIFTAFGIPVELHISFLLLMLFIYIIALLGTISLYIAFLITLLFVTVVVHELSHSYVAKRYGVKISKIVLLPIGGVSEMEEIPKDPDQELKISAAGPLANIVIAFICFIGLILAGGIGSLTFNSFFISNTPSVDLSLFLANFLGVNLVLGLFNLLPAFPMDGGRVLRAFFAKRMSYIEATKKAASVGKQFAILMVILGIFFNFILILIAIFIYLGADQEYKNIIISSKLEGINVRDIMTKEVNTLTPDTSIGEALNIMFRQRHMGYPVEDHGELVGIVTFEDISKIPENQRDSPIGNIMTRELILASPDEPAMDSLERITRNNIGRLPVTENGNLVGIISKTDIIRALEVLDTKPRD